MNTPHQPDEREAWFRGIPREGFPAPEQRQAAGPWAEADPLTGPLPASDGGYGAPPDERPESAQAGPEISQGFAPAPQRQHAERVPRYVSPEPPLDQQLEPAYDRQPPHPVEPPQSSAYPAPSGHPQGPGGGEAAIDHASFERASADELVDALRVDDPAFHTAGGDQPRYDAEPHYDGDQPHFDGDQARYDAEPRFEGDRPRYDGEQSRSEDGGFRAAGQSPAEARFQTPGDGSPGGAHPDATFGGASQEAPTRAVEQPVSAPASGPPRHQFADPGTPAESSTSALPTLPPPGAPVGQPYGVRPEEPGIPPSLVPMLAGPDQPSHRTEPISGGTMYGPPHQTTTPRQPASGTAGNPAVLAAVALCTLLAVVPGVLLLYSALFGGEGVSASGAVSGTLLLIGLPLVATGLYPVLSGAETGRDGVRSALRAPLVYVLVGLVLLLAAGLAAS